jgi:hypothetical protein
LSVDDDDTGNVILEPCEGAEIYVNGKLVTTPTLLRSGKA